MITRAKKFIQHLLWHVSPLGAALVLVWAAQQVDRSIPVVRDFKILNQQMTKDGVLIDGIMDKRRDCSFEALSAYADGHMPVNIRILHKPQGIADVSRAVRVQLWGPWEILSGEANTIELFVQHRCHMFWSMTTPLIKFTVVRVPEKTNADQRPVESGPKKSLEYQIPGTSRTSKRP